MTESTIKERVATLEAAHDTNETRHGEQRETNSDLYKRTEANSLANATIEANTKTTKALLWLFISGLASLIVMVLGSVLVHWLLAGKPGM